MELRYCKVCGDGTRHVNGNCQVCKSKAFHERKAQVKPGTMCHRMIALEETIYDIKKEITNG